MSVCCVRTKTDRMMPSSSTGSRATKEAEVTGLPVPQQAKDLKRR